MNKNEYSRELLTIILAVIILSISITFLSFTDFIEVFTCMTIIIFANILTKKLVAYHFEANTKIKFWSWYSFGLKDRSHFKKPIPMVWLPLILAPLGWKWLGILETEITARTERVSRRHGLYRLSEITEWHSLWIISWALIINLILGFVGYKLGFEIFGKLSLYYSIWSIIPLSNLDGSKIFFGNRIIWMILAIVVLISFNLINPIF